MKKNKAKYFLFKYRKIIAIAFICILFVSLMIVVMSKIDFKNIWNNIAFVGFLGTILGAFLSIVGGIVSSIVTSRLSEKKDLQTCKKETYLKTLVCCQKAISFEEVNAKEFLTEMSEMKSYILLYGSRNVQREYNTFYNIITKKNNDTKRKDLLICQLSNISCVMKEEVGSADEKEKEIAFYLNSGGTE